MTHCTKGKRRGSVKGRMGSEGITTQQKRGESDYTDEALAFLNDLKLLMNMWRAMISGLDIELKLSKKPLPRVLNLNILRGGQLSLKTEKQSYQKKKVYLFNKSIIYIDE